MKPTSIQEANTNEPILLELEIGKLYEFHGDIVELSAIAGRDCSVQRVHTGRHLTVDHRDLKPLHDEGRRSRDYRRVTDDEWEKAKKRAAVVAEIIDLCITSRSRLDELGKSIGIGHRQLQRLVARYQANRTVSSCLDRACGPKFGNNRKHTKRAIIDKAIDHCLRKLEDTSAEDIRSTAESIVTEKDSVPLSEITINIVRHRLRQRGIELRKRRALGPEKYKEARLVLPGKHNVSGPLAEVQIDHTQADLMILDESRQYCLGRPWLTLAMDIFSRMILGFYLSLQPPSLISVARALTISVLPKNELLNRLGLGHLRWSAMGKPVIVKSDNGGE